MTLEDRTSVYYDSNFWSFDLHFLVFKIWFLRSFLKIMNLGSFLKRLKGASILTLMEFMEYCVQTFVSKTQKLAPNCGSFNKVFVVENWSTLTFRRDTSQFGSILGFENCLVEKMLICDQKIFEFTNINTEFSKNDSVSPSMPEPIVYLLPCQFPSD